MTTSRIAVVQGAPGAVVDELLAAAVARWSPRLRIVTKARLVAHLHRRVFFVANYFISSGPDMMTGTRNGPSDGQAAKQG